ncbi:MAG: phosphatidylglycerol lysyltransferase domain-containing protein [Candidatus Margulisiibacteriota bacterium]
MRPEFPAFKSIELSDLPLISEHLSRYQPEICELSATNLYIWHNFDRGAYTFINDNLCLKVHLVGDAPYFLEPIGIKMIPETVELCLKETGRLSRVSERLLRQLPLSKIRAHCLRSQNDYLYETSSLAEYKGGHFDGKRNHVKRFDKLYPDHVYVSIDQSSKAAVIALFEKWFAARKETHFFQKLAYGAQRQALLNSFDHFNELGLIGGGLIAGGELKSFAIGSRLNSNTVTAHFQYSDPTAPGATQTLWQKACKEAFSKFARINFEQDLGIPGLRKSKLSYHPKKIEKKYEIRLKPGVTSLL